jgi:hypothetical protein
MVDLRRREFITLLGGRSGGLIRQIDACSSQLSDSKAKHRDRALPCTIP